MRFVKTFLIVLVSLLIGAGMTAYIVKQQPQLLGITKSPTQVQNEIDFLVSEVRKLIELPADERPTVATVSDVEKVRNQAFFAKAQNGDKVLIYTNARRAILYRPSENRIIEVGAVNINQTTPSPSSESTPQASPSTE